MLVCVCPGRYRLASRTKCRIDNSFLRCDVTKHSVSEQQSPKVVIENQDETNEAQFTKVAALIGEKSRAIMLWNLLEGRAYTATELADCAGVSRQTCSDHLSKLVDGGLLTFATEGRHRYYEFASENAAQAIEKMAYLMAPGGAAHNFSMLSQSGFRYARTCYDHLAGKVAVRLTDALLSKRIITSRPNEFKVGRSGEEWFDGNGIDVHELRRMKRKFACPCLEWSERRNHIGGALGSAVLNLLLRNDWIRRRENSREIIITTKGKIELRDKFNVEL